MIRARSLIIYVDSAVTERTANIRTIKGSIADLDVFRIEQSVAVMDLPEISVDADDDDVKPWFNEAELAGKLEQLVLTEEECICLDHDGKSEYCKASQKTFNISFEISYDFDYSDRDILRKDLREDVASKIFETKAENPRMTVTSVGIYFESDDTAPVRFKGADRDSRIVMNDGTVYYLFEFVGFNKGFVLNYSTVPACEVYTRLHAIDPREIQSVIINGEEFYQ